MDRYGYKNRKLQSYLKDGGGGAKCGKESPLVYNLRTKKIQLRLLRFDLKKNLTSH